MHQSCKKKKQQKKQHKITVNMYLPQTIQYSPDHLQVILFWFAIFNKRPQNRNLISHNQQHIHIIT